MTEGGIFTPARLRRARPWLFSVYVLAAVAATVHRGFWLGHRTYPIFRGSFYHLIAGHDLYAAYPALQGGDLFKYSPTFALLYAPFALLPHFPGLLLWNLVNVAILWWAMERLLPRTEAVLALLLIGPALWKNLDASQSNALVAALIVLAFVAFERGRPGRGTLVTAVGTLIKIYPMGALSFAVFRPRRFRTALLFGLSLALLIALPLLVISPHGLWAQYVSWHAVEMRDARNLVFGESVMVFVRRLLHVGWPSWPMQLIGVALLLAPVVLRRERWDERSFRISFLSSFLVFAMLFNHQAEAASLVIAATGVGIWYAAGSRSAIRLLLVLATLPDLSVVPLVLVWGVMQVDLLGRGPAAVAQRAANPTS